MVTMLMLLAGMMLLLGQLMHSLLAMHKLVGLQSQQMNQHENLRKAGQLIIKQGQWPTKCFLQPAGSMTGCQFNQYYYAIEAKFPAYCDVYWQGASWQDVQHYQLWLWHPKHRAGYFARFVVVRHTQLCSAPKRYFKQAILSQSIQLEGTIGVNKGTLYFKKGTD